MNPITNFVRVARRDGWKEAWKKLKYQFVMLQTPESRIKQELWGYAGTMTGLFIATPFMAWIGKWYFCFVTVGGFWLSFTNFRGRLQQLYTIKEIKQKMKNENIVK